MESYQSFESVFNMSLAQVWQQMVQQQLEQQQQQRHQQEQQQNQLSMSSFAMAEWLEQQQQQQRQTALQTSTWHPPLPPPPPTSATPPGLLPPLSHLLEPHVSPAPLLDVQPAVAPDSAALKWRQLPATLRRRASAQAASSLLKAWMRQHADNPYPSKREKSALAALTNMSFAQISTWFANARRRLKKDAMGAAGGAEVGSGRGSGSSPVGRTTDNSSKPRIWSLVETAMKDNDGPSPTRAAASFDERVLPKAAAAETFAADVTYFSCTRCDGPISSQYSALYS